MVEGNVRVRPSTYPIKSSGRKIEKRLGGRRRKTGPIRVEEGVNTFHNKDVI